MDAKQLKEKLQALINKAVLNERYIDFTIINVFNDGKPKECERFKITEPTLVAVDNDSWRGHFAQELILRSKREVLIFNCASSSVDISITITVKDPSDCDNTVEELSFKHNGVEYIEI